MHTVKHELTRRSLLAAGAIGATAWGIAQQCIVAEESVKIVSPPTGRAILLSCKLGMIDKKDKATGKVYSLAERLIMAQSAGFDGVDFDEAGSFTIEEARSAVRESGVFVHNAINHAHWKQRLTSPLEQERTASRKNIEHCLRLSHAAGGSAVLIVIGTGKDGTKVETEDRARTEINKLIPLAAALGQPILFENVWNQMFYEHDQPPEQGPEKFIKFVDSFHSPWVGMYYDIGNHWKYGQPLEWIRGFGRRIVKLDIKGFSRAKNKFVDITSEEDDLPWGDVQKGLKEIGFTGWATAEVGGGDIARLTIVRKQMEKALGI